MPDPVYVNKHVTVLSVRGALLTYAPSTVQAVMVTVHTVDFSHKILRGGKPFIIFLFNFFFVLFCFVTHIPFKSEPIFCFCNLLP